MLYATIKYRIPGIYKAMPAPVSVQVDGPVAVRVEVAAPETPNLADATLWLSAALNGNFTQEQARSAADRAVAIVVNRISYFWSSPLGTPLFSEANHETIDAIGERVLGVSQGIVFLDMVGGVAVVTNEQLGELEQFLAQPAHPGESFFELFRLGLQCKDPIALFLCLYGILLLTQGDAQRRVDDFVESEGTPRTEPSTRPNAKLDDRDTIYTSLRNAVGHPKSEASIASVRQEMERHISGLVTLAKKAIAGYTQ